MTVPKEKTKIMYKKNIEKLSKKYNVNKIQQ